MKQTPHSNEETIAILGCGWLGLPLAQKLMEVGFSVNGSTTSENKIDLLRDCGINPFLINLSEEGFLADITSFLEPSETLILNIPPNLQRNSTGNFVKKIKNILPAVEKSGIKNLLFISSTSVYENAIDFPEITENSSLNAISESGKQLIAAEKLLQKNVHFNTTIIRFGGLIGGERHPINFLSGKKGVKNPNAPINLIDREDCIQLIVQVIRQNYWQKILNAVYPYHPTRKEYYLSIAKNKNLKAPIFVEGSTSKGKVVISTKLERELGFAFTCHI